MNIFNSLLGKNILGGALAVLIAGLTVFSTGAGVIKVANGLQNVQSHVPEVLASSDTKTEAKAATQTEDKAESSDRNRPATPKTTKAVVNLGASANNSQAAAKTTVAAAVSPQPANVNSQSGCLITLFGKQYDVTALQTTHSGGNVFNCGTDMTATYVSRHGTDVSRMQPYLVSANGTGASGVTATNTGSSATTSQTNPAPSNQLPQVDSQHDTSETEEDEHNEIEDALERVVRHEENDD